MLSNIYVALVSQMNKEDKLGPTSQIIHVCAIRLRQELVRNVSFSRLEWQVYSTHLPLCRIFYFPWYRHQIEGINGL